MNTSEFVVLPLLAPQHIPTGGLHICPHCCIYLHKPYPTLTRTLSSTGKSMPQTIGQARKQGPLPGHPRLEQQPLEFCTTSGTLHPMHSLSSPLRMGLSMRIWSNSSRTRSKLPLRLAASIDYDGEYLRLTCSSSILTSRTPRNNKVCSIHTYCVPSHLSSGRGSHCCFFPGHPFEATLVQGTSAQ